MYAYAYVCVCMCVCVCMWVAHGEVRHAGWCGMHLMSCDTVCQVSAGTVSETVLQMCVWVMVIEVMCMEG